MNCSYRRKRIPGLPPEATRAIDDELAAIERLANCVVENAGVPTSRLVETQNGLTGGGALSDDLMLEPVYGTTANTVCEGNDARVVAAVPNTRTVNAGTGLSGGGDLSADRSFAVAYGTTSGTACEGNDSRVANAVPNTRTVSAGTGLSGGGDLSANRTLAVTYGTTAGTACEGNDARLSASTGMSFASYWDATQTYAENDVVIDGPYLCIAKATTTDKPGPSFTQATPAWNMTPGVIGTWYEDTPGYTKFIGQRYGPLAGDTLAQGVRFYAITSGTIKSAYLMVNEAGRFDVAQNLVTTASAWTEVLFPPVILRAGDEVDFIVEIESGEPYTYNATDWPSGGINQSFFSNITLTYPPSSFYVTKFGMDVLIQSGTQSADWVVLTKSAA